MPRTSPEPARNPVPESGARVVAFGAYDAAPDLTVLEFCVGMALARKGPLTARGIAAEISAWFDHPVRARSLSAQLDAIVRRGWARLEAGTYTIADAGSEALSGFYCALVRLLDGGRRLLDLGVFMSLIKEFERSGS
ncbi:hypothetical protein ACQKO5_14945 [Novosphingobium subterraneum]|uniref:hypothetical protein n=1 Tax=Novosphingobium subterraneum TaxID=48936 RepID=UPI003D01DE8D